MNALCDIEISLSIWLESLTASTLEMSFAKEWMRLMGLKSVIISVVSFLGMRVMAAEFMRSKGPVLKQYRQLKAPKTSGLIMCQQDL